MKKLGLIFFYLLIVTSSLAEGVEQIDEGRYKFWANFTLITGEISPIIVSYKNKENKWPENKNDIEQHASNNSLTFRGKLYCEIEIIAISDKKITLLVSLANPNISNTCFESMKNNLTLEKGKLVSITENEKEAWEKKVINKSLGL
jgi:hypothetical protein